MEKKYLACAYGVGWWWSKKAHCNSCLNEKELGYGEDIDGCCCIHLKETEEERGKIYETPAEAEKDNLDKYYYE